MDHVLSQRSRGPADPQALGYFVDDPAHPLIRIRPFSEQRDYERMIDYFLGADDVLLLAMGVDRKRFPKREVWLEAVLEDHARSDSMKDRSYLAWEYEGTPVGHSSINKIKLGEEAYIHLHLWASNLRKAGLGMRYFQASVAEFMRMFELKRLYCEPYAENPGPNHVLLKSGFRFIKRYRTNPSAHTFDQDVNRYVLETSVRCAD